MVDFTYLRNDYLFNNCVLHFSIYGCAALRFWGSARSKSDRKPEKRDSGVARGNSESEKKGCLIRRKDVASG
jgi:hypothetical protein